MLRLSALHNSARMDIFTSQPCWEMSHMRRRSAAPGVLEAFLSEMKLNIEPGTSKKALSSMVSKSVSLILNAGARSATTARLWTTSGSVQPYMIYVCWIHKSTWCLCWSPDTLKGHFRAFSRSRPPSETPGLRNQTTPVWLFCYVLLVGFGVKAVMLCPGVFSPYPHFRRRGPDKPRFFYPAGGGLVEGMETWHVGVCRDAAFHCTSNCWISMQAASSLNEAVHTLSCCLVCLSRQQT